MRQPKLTLFLDYISLEEEEEVREVDSTGVPRQIGAKQTGIGSSSSGKSVQFLLQPEVTPRKNSGLGLLQDPPANNNRHAASSHFARRTVWAQPPPSFKRGSDHLEKRSTKRS